MINPTTFLHIFKLSKILAKYEIDAKLTFKYLSKWNQRVLRKKEFKKNIQSFSLDFVQDDIEQLYYYFDPKDYGEVPE